MADLHRTLQDDRHRGWGYAEVEMLPKETQLLADEAIIDRANALGWNYEQLFAWSNSKYARWFCDILHGGTLEQAMKEVTLEGLDVEASLTSPVDKCYSGRVTADEDGWTCPGCGAVVDDPRLHASGYTATIDGELVEVEGCPHIDGAGNLAEFRKLESVPDDGLCYSFVGTGSHCADCGVSYSGHFTSYDSGSSVGTPRPKIAAAPPESAGPCPECGSSNTEMADTTTGPEFSCNACGHQGDPDEYGRESRNNSQRSGSAPVEGARYRLLKPMHELASNGRVFPAGTEFTLVQRTLDYLDWFCSVIEVDGQQYRVGWAVSDPAHSEVINGDD